MHKFKSEKINISCLWVAELSDLKLFPCNSFLNTFQIFKTKHKTARLECHRQNF